MKRTQSFALLLVLCVGFILGMGYSHIAKSPEPAPGQDKLDAELAKIRALQDRESAKIQALAQSEGRKP